VLVAVQLVDDLGIAPPAIVRRPVIGPKSPLPYTAGDRVAVPIDLGAKPDRPVTEKRNLMPAQSFRLVDSPVDPLGKILLDKWPQVFAVAPIEAIPRRLGQVVLERRRNRRRRVAVADAGAHPVQLRIHLLPDSVR
jgi:hypothetical protein